MRVRVTAWVVARIALTTLIVVPPILELPIPWRTRMIGHFGWHMYAHPHGAPHFRAVLPDGRTVPVQPPAFASAAWGDFGFADSLRARACRVVPNAVTVIVDPDGPQGGRGTTPCRR